MCYCARVPVAVRGSSARGSRLAPWSFDVRLGNVIRHDSAHHDPQRRPGLPSGGSRAAPGRGGATSLGLPALGLPGDHHTHLRVPGGLRAARRRGRGRPDLQVRGPADGSAAGIAGGPHSAGGSPGGDHAAPGPAPAPAGLYGKRVPVPRAPRGPTAGIHPDRGGADRAGGGRGRCRDDRHGGRGLSGGGPGRVPDRRGAGRGGARPPEHPAAAAARPLADRVGPAPERPVGTASRC